MFTFSVDRWPRVRHKLLVALAALAVPTVTQGIAARSPSSPAALAQSPAAAPPTLAGCGVLPADNIWNSPVDTLPLDPQSQAYVNTIGASAALKADFGAGLWNGGPIGIPFVVVPGTQAKVNVPFRWPGESDAGPYPIPPNPPIEGGNNSDGDRHVLMLDKDNCTLYELYHVYPNGSGWKADSGAIFDLTSNTLRPETWTSADAAGLPILPGLVRYDEVAAGEIRHAVRFTVPETRRAYVWPGRHFASSHLEARFPPMGQRFRLKAGVDIGGYPADVQVILRAMKKYGLMLADNGSAWFVSGVPDERWNNDHLAQMRRLRGSDFEAVDVSSLMVTKDSGQVKGGAVPTSTTAPALTPEPEPTPTPESTATIEPPAWTPTATVSPVSETATPAPSPTTRIPGLATDTSGETWARVFFPRCTR